MLRLTFIYLLLIPILSNAQTCIIARKVDNQIYIGADSRVMVITPNRTSSDTTYETMCKINLHDNLNFAMAGFLVDSMLKYANKSCLRNIPADSVVYDFAKQFVFTLQSYIEHDRIKFPNFYKTYYHKDSVLCSVIFFGMNYNSAILYNVYFYPITSIEEKTQIQCKFNTYNAVAIGEVAEIYAKNLLFDSKTWEHGTIEGIKSLINYEHNFHSKEIGPPYYFLSCSKQGISWIPADHFCK